MKLYELKPIDGRKSFYGKAVVMIDGTTETLLSYNTPIVRRDTTTGALTRLWCGWSATTGRHIAAFCGMNKAAFTALPCAGSGAAADMTPTESLQAMYARRSCGATI